MDIYGSFFPNGATSYVSSAGETAGVKTVKSGAGVLHYLRVTNTNAAARFVWVFDNTAASGTALLTAIQVPASSDREMMLPFTIPFTTGLTIAHSSTQATYTATGAAELLIHAVYK